MRVQFRTLDWSFLVAAWTAGLRLCDGRFFSRKLERATYDRVAFRFIAANDHPDHETIAAFRRRFLKEIEAMFVQVLLRRARWAF